MSVKTDNGQTLVNALNRIDELEALNEKLTAALKEKMIYQEGAYVLRKQAEAVESAKKHYNANSRIPDGTLSRDYEIGYAGAEGAFQDSLDAYAQRLRTQANELEAGGGYASGI